MNTELRKIDQLEAANEALRSEISERKEVERKLAEDLNYQTNLLAAVSEAIIVTDVAFNIKTWNKAAEEIYGWTADEVIGKNIGQVLVTEYEHLEPEDVLKQFLRDGHWQGEVIQTVKDGSKRYLLSSVTVLHNKTGKPDGAVAINRDITERREAQDANLVINELLRMTGEMTKVGGWEFDAQTQLGMWTDEVARIHDLEPNQSTDVEMGLSFYSGENREKIEKAVSEAVELAKPYELELEMVTAKGNHKWVRTMGLPVTENGKVIKVRGIFQDITERKQAEEQLRLQSAALESTANSIVITNRQGEIQWVNPAFTQMTGYSFSESAGRNMRELVKSDKQDVSVYKDLWKTILAGQVWRGELVNHRKDGSLYIEDQTITPLLGEFGEVTHFIAVQQDITERKNLEEEHAQLTAQYHQAQKMESIGRLAGGIAHDFNNLLVPIINNAELTMMAISKADPSYVRLQRIIEAGQRAADLTRQILAFSRQQELEKKVLDLNEVISDFEPMLHRLIGEDVVLETHLVNDLPPLIADKGQLEQVLLNLVVNARDAMPEGGRLLIETNQVDLDEAYVAKHAEVQPGPHAMMAVSDTGDGMDAATQQQIFEPFFTTKSQGEGTGLGLATVFGIVKQHGGNIWVYSEPGYGSTFKIYLPLAEALVLEEAPEANEIGLVAGSETVLLVEDETAVRQLVGEILREYGYRVLEAAEPKAGLALAVLDEGPIDLLLTDVIMPNMNGRKLYEELALEHPDLKVLFMSGYTYNIVEQHDVLDEDTDFLQKPFTVEQLLQKVRMVLG